MASAVQIELIVDNAGAVQGIRAFNAAIQGTKADVSQLDASLQKLNQHFAAPAVKWSSAPKAAGQALQEMGGHAMTSLDSVRLLRQEFGLWMPRALEAAISRSETLMKIIGAMGPMMLTIGGIGIAASAGREIYDLYKKYLDVTAAAKAYRDEVQKVRFEDFGNPRSIEETTQRIREAADTVKYYQSIVKKSQGQEAPSWMIPALPVNLYLQHKAKVAQTKENQYQESLDKMQQDLLPEQKHQAILDATRSDPYYLPHPGETHQQEMARRLREQNVENDENQKYTAALSGVKGNNPVTDAGKKHEAALDAEEQAEANTEFFNIQRDQTTDLRHLRDEANEAALRGIALRSYQEQAAITDLIEKEKQAGYTKQQVAASVDSVKLKFHNAELQRVHEEALETERMGRQASLGGMKGIGKIQAEGANRIADINADENLSPAARLSRIADAQRETNAQMLEATSTFTDQVDALSDASAEHQISGFARIAADGQRQLDALQRKFDDTYGQIDVYAPGGIEAYSAGLAQLNRGKSAIGVSTQDQQAELTKRNSEETDQIEAEARSKLLSSEKQKTAAIEQEYEERVRKYKDALNEQEISQDDFNRRVEAANLDMQAELQEQANQTRQKIASELSGLIGAHPLQGLERMGEKSAAQAGGAILQRLGTHFGVGTGAGGWFGRLAHGQHSTQDLHAEMPQIAGVHAGDGTFHLQSATIYVTNAQFGRGGASGGTRGSQPALLGEPDLSGSGWGAGSSSGDSSWMTTGVGGGVGSGSSSSGAGAIVPVNAAPTPGGGIAGAVSETMQGVQTTRSIASMIQQGRAKSAALETSNPLAGMKTTLNPDGTTTTVPAGNGSMLSSGLTASNAMGAAGAGLGLFSAYKTGGMGGTLGGAMSGAQLGMEVGGPIGAAVGAIAGAAIGFFGGAGQARVWWEKNGRPRLAQDVQGFENGSEDYLSAYMDMESLKTQAHQTLSKMGFMGSRYYHDTVTGEITREEGKLTREARAGRQQYGPASAEYDTGGLIDDFGDLSTTPGHGLIHAQQGEFMMQPRVYRRYPDALHRLNSGASLESVAAGYRATMQPAAGRGSAPASAWGGDLHIHAIDTQSGVDFLMKHKHNVRAAMNSSYGENSGGADAGI